MKGKKIDNEFLSEFISNCIKKGLFSSEEIVGLAQSKITDIDLKIREVESLKLLRSKLLDVITAFKKTNKDKKDDNELLSFYKIQNAQISKLICDNVKNKLNIINMIYDTKQFSTTDIIFCIKQLLENKIILKTEGNYFIEGEMFEQYYSFLLKSNN